MSLAARIAQIAGYSAKQEQVEVIKTFLGGSDVIFCAPTGFGKSLTYQCAPELLQGSVIVIIPLLSLLQNSLEKTKRFGLCTSLSSQSKDQDHGNSKFLFTTAESLLEGSGRQLLNDKDFTKSVRAVFIDEAHVIHSYTMTTGKQDPFRKAYSRLGELRSFLDDVPYIALTATATAEVISTVSTSLEMQSPRLIYVRKDKPNISYYVEKVGREVPLNFQWLVDVQRDGFSGRILIFFQNVEQTGIVYDFLKVNFDNERTPKPSLHMYHSGTKPEKKAQTVAEFSLPLEPKEFSVVLCTSSFSLGLDLADIEYVLHFGVPNTVTDYVQETGRASREPSKHGHAILLTHHRMGVGRPIERAMRDFYKTSNCRRKTLMAEFRIQPGHNEKCCDSCVWDLSLSCPLVSYIQTDTKSHPESASEHSSVYSESTISESISTPTPSSLSDLSD